MKVDGYQMTGGIDLESKYSIMLHRVNEVPCICVHECSIRDGLHYTKANEDSLVCAIPAETIVKLCKEFYKL